jgi:hypothetical protein
MDSNYRATDENWRDAGAFASDTKACILELRARIEALEATQQPQQDQSRDTPKMVDTGWRRLHDLSPIMEPAPPAPAGGLVERLKLIIAKTVASETLGEVEPESWDGEARAVIREVAASALEMASDKNLTWERVALWLDREALQ